MTRLHYDEDYISGRYDSGERYHVYADGQLMYDAVSANDADDLRKELELKGYEVEVEFAFNEYED